MACPDGKIINPSTGRCVDINGKIGMQLAKKMISPKAATNKKQMASSDIWKHLVAQEADYLILVTGYTSRLAKLIGQSSLKREINTGPASTFSYISCIKDYENWRSYCDTKTEGNKIKKMLDNIKPGKGLSFITGSLVVIKLGNNATPFEALRAFNDKFGAKSTNNFCETFDGIPMHLFCFNDEALGSIALMTFPTADDFSYE